MSKGTKLLFKSGNASLVGKVLQPLNTCSSTNEWLKEHTMPHGTVVYTTHQQAGKGQRGHTWQDRPGENLALSILLSDLLLPVTKAFLLNKAIAIAVHDVVQALARHSITLKWPNDVMWRDQKLAGILIENQLQGERVSQSIIGIGINADVQAFGPDLPQATSLRLITGQAHPPTHLVDPLVAALRYRLTQLHEGDTKALDQAYQERLYHLGVVRLFRVNGDWRYGTLTGVTHAGALQVMWNGGTQQAYQHGTIGWG